MEFNSEALVLFTEGYRNILAGFEKLGFDTSDPNFADTAARAARGLHELVYDQAQVRSQIASMLEKTFPAKYTEMVISKHNMAFGICPHHLLPVIYRISLAYIPVEKVLGLSKLSRLARIQARSPILQEDLTHELCRTLHEDLASHGAAVYVEGLHLCMAARGIGAHEARLVTSAVRGVFLEKMATREEFVKLVTASHPTLV